MNTVIVFSPQDSAVQNFPRNSRSYWGLEYTVPFSSGVRRMELEASHSPSANIECKNECRYTSSPTAQSQLYLSPFSVLHCCNQQVLYLPPKPASLNVTITCDHSTSASVCWFRSCIMQTFKTMLWELLLLLEWGLLVFLWEVTIFWRPGERGGGGGRGANNASVFTACCRQLEGN